ncbi:MAG: ATP-binding protein [Candidatus Omnitrophota bacterium]
MGSKGKAKGIKALQAEGVCLHYTIDKSPDGAVILDKDGTMLFVNAPAETFFDKKAKALIGRSFDHPFKEGKTTEIDVAHKDGKMRFGEVRVFDAEWEGKPARMVSIRDITERKELGRLKDEFISTVSHELRTPMTTIRESISQILDGILGETTKEQREFLSICLEDIDRLKRIVDNLLEVAMIKAGAVQIRRNVVDIGELAEEASSLFNAQARKKGLEIRKTFPDKRVEVYADRDKIIQVFSNLVSNALNFTEKGHIDIGVEDKGKSVECYVSDTGIGIAEKDFPRVFGKFQQFGRLGGPGEQGTGLGLFIAKGIVDLHRGKISVESKLDQGTKFTFALPKFSPEEIVYDSIDKRIAVARKGHEEFSVFVIRLDDYSGDAREVFSRMMEIKNVLMDENIIAVKGDNEIVVLAAADEQDISRVIGRMKRAIKESLLEITEEGLEIDFSYGRATYPVDAIDAEDLLKKAGENLVSEKEERLKKNVMVVDDNPAVVENLKRFLNKFGYKNVTKARNGAEALKKVEVKPPDLMILDMKMPKMNGYEVIGRLKEDTKTKDIPVLIMSGYEVEIDKLREYVKKKAIPAVTKPIDIKEFKKLVDFLL